MDQLYPRKCVMDGSERGRCLDAQPERTLSDNEWPSWIVVQGGQPLRSSIHPPIEVVSQ